jgi:hypothetical protein
MTEDSKKADKEPFQFEPKHFVIIIPIVLILSIGILAASIYLFTNPSLISGIVFGVVMLVLFVGPITFAIVFYFRRVKAPTQEITEKKKLEVQRVE